MHPNVTGLVFPQSMLPNTLVQPGFSNEQHMIIVGLGAYNNFFTEFY